MAKTQAKADATVAVEFFRTGNAWIDAGIVGLYRILNRLPSYTEYSGTPEPKDGADASLPYVKTDDLRSDRLVVTGAARQVQACLEWAYDQLVGLYFNKSSEKQRRELSSYNFFYDRSKNDFSTFPKVKATGVASLLFDKAARPARDQVSVGSDYRRPGKRGANARSLAPGARASANATRRFLQHTRA